MQNGDRLEAGESLSAHNGACRLRLTKTGVLQVQRKFENHPIYKDNYVTAWTSGVAQNKGDYFASLNRDGNFVVYERHKGQKNSVAYRTRTNDPSNVGATITLNFDKTCRLSLYSDDAYNAKFHGFLWDNIKRSLTGYKLLQKGEMFHDRENAYYSGPCLGVELPVTLYLTHDCNLEMFIGTDLATRYYYVGNVWDANVTRPDLEDCYLYANANGLTLHEGVFKKKERKFIKNLPGEYWATYRYDYYDEDDKECEGTEVNCWDGDYEAVLDPPHGIYLYLH